MKHPMLTRVLAESPDQQKAEKYIGHVDELYKLLPPNSAITESQIKWVVAAYLNDPSKQKALQGVKIVLDDLIERVARNKETWDK